MKELNERAKSLGIFLQDIQKRWSDLPNYLEEARTVLIRLDNESTFC